MKIKRTWLERLFSLTPWVTHRDESESERLQRIARSVLESGMTPFGEVAARKSFTKPNIEIGVDASPAAQAFRDLAKASKDFGHRPPRPMPAPAPRKFIAPPELPKSADQMLHEYEEGERIRQKALTRKGNEAVSVQTFRRDDVRSEVYLQQMRKDDDAMVDDMIALGMMAFTAQSLACPAPEPAPRIESGGGGDFSGGGADASYGGSE